MKGGMLMSQKGKGVRPVQKVPKAQAGGFLLFSACLTKTDVRRDKGRWTWAYAFFFSATHGRFPPCMMNATA